MNEPPIRGFVDFTTEEKRKSRACGVVLNELKATTDLLLADDSCSPQSLELVDAYRKTGHGVIWLMGNPKGLTQAQRSTIYQHAGQVSFDCGEDLSKGYIDFCSINSIRQARKWAVYHLQVSALALAKDFSSKDQPLRRSIIDSKLPCLCLDTHLLAAYIFGLQSGVQGISDELMRALGLTGGFTGALADMRAYLQPLGLSASVGGQQGLTQGLRHCLGELCCGSIIIPVPFSLKGMDKKPDPGTEHSYPFFDDPTKEDQSTKKKETVHVNLVRPVSTMSTNSANTFTTDPLYNLPQKPRLVVATACRLTSVYTPEVVKWFRRQVAEKLLTPHTFVCLTDKPELVPGGIALQQNWTGWWTKMELFRPGLFQQDEAVLYFDLDTVLISPFEAPSTPNAGDIMMLNLGVSLTKYGSGVMYWRVPLTSPYDIFTNNPDDAMEWFPSDQEVIAASVYHSGGKIMWMPGTEIQPFTNGKGVIPAKKPVGPIWCAPWIERVPFDRLFPKNQTPNENKPIQKTEHSQNRIKQETQLSIAPPKPAPKEVEVTLASPSEQGTIQIDITNVCQHKCSNCTRFCGHNSPNFFMSTEQFKQAVDSLQTFRKMVGVMGGEPTIHPNFREMVLYLNRRRPEAERGPEQYEPTLDWEKTNSELLTFKACRKGLWTGLGPGYRKHFELIQSIFHYQCINDHRGGAKHMALLMSRKDLGIPDEEWLRYRNACWLQHSWSATINHRGAYFCEVAAALSLMFKGPDGWKVEPEWWKRKASEFGDQLEMCEYCSACLPVPQQLDADECDMVTPGMEVKIREVGSKKKLNVITDTWEELKKKYKANTSCAPYMDGSDRLRIHQPSGIEVGNVVGVVVCRGYDDYLGLTLERTVSELSRVIVVTSNADKATQRVAKHFGAELFLTNTLDSSDFKKGKAIAECLDTLPRDSWVVLLDADIILHKNFGKKLCSMTLNPGALYYTVRIGPPLEDWKSSVNFAKMALSPSKWDMNYSDDPLRETIGVRLYVQKAPLGYCQIFNLSSSTLKERSRLYPNSSTSAESDDYHFSMNWYGKSKCIMFPDEDMTVFHLAHGISRGNWSGRVSPRLDSDNWWIDDPTLKWRINYRSGVNFSGLWQLTKSIKLPEGSVIIEIGTALGDSACLFATAFPGVRIITVDPSTNPKVFEEAASRTSLWPKIEMWQMYSNQAAERAKAEGIKIGMVYIDGDHEEEGVRNDIHYWKPLLISGGYLCGHDYNCPDWMGVKKAVDEALGKPIQIFPDSSWIGWIAP